MAVAIRESKTNYFIHIRPGHPALLDETIQWIEDHCTPKKPDPAEEQKINIISLENDPEREAALRRQGFELGPIYGILRVRDLDAPIPEAPLPEGYKIRASPEQRGL